MTNPKPPADQGNIYDAFNEVRLKALAFRDDRDALQAKLDEASSFSDADQRDLNIGRAIQRAAMELPESCSISIELSIGSGSVVWCGSGGGMNATQSSEPFSAQIHAAIDAAIASVSHK